MNQFSKANGKTDRQKKVEPENMGYALVKRVKKNDKNLWFSDLFRGYRNVTLD